MLRRFLTRLVLGLNCTTLGLERRGDLAVVLTQLAIKEEDALDLLDLRELLVPATDSVYNHLFHLSVRTNGFDVVFDVRAA